MSREEIEKFLTDEGRAKVAQFMADSGGEDDDVDMDEVVRQNLADHTAAMGDGIETGTGHGHGPFRDDLRSQLVTAGTAAAEQWLTDRANRKMSDVNRRRLAGHVVNAIWVEIENAVLEIAQYVGDEQLAAATERAVKAEAERDAYASEYHRLDSEQAAAGSYANRAENAEAEVERLRKANHDLAKHDLASMNRATATEEALAELRERIGETPGLGGYTIGCDGDDATQWPYVECNRCRHDVWTGRYTGSALNLADAVDQVAAHDCDKAAKLRNIITEGG